MGLKKILIILFNLFLVSCAGPQKTIKIESNVPARIEINDRNLGTTPTTFTVTCPIDSSYIYSYFFSARAPNSIVQHKSAHQRDVCQSKEEYTIFFDMDVSEARTPQSKDKRSKNKK